MIIPTSHITINFYFYFCCVKCNRLILQKLIPRCLDMILVAFSLCPYFPFNSENASPRNDFMTFALFAERRCQQRRWTPPPTWAPCQAPIQPPPPPNHFFRSVFKSLFYQHGRVLLTQTAAQIKVKTLHALLKRQQTLQSVFYGRFDKHHLQLSLSSKILTMHNLIR